MNGAHTTVTEDGRSLSRPVNGCSILRLYGGREWTITLDGMAASEMYRGER